MFSLKLCCGRCCVEEKKVPIEKNKDLDNPVARSGILDGGDDVDPMEL